MTSPTSSASGWRKTATFSMPAGRSSASARAFRGEICRGERAKTKPTAFAPALAAASIALALVMPQIFTNIVAPLSWLVVSRCGLAAGGDEVGDRLPRRLGAHQRRGDEREPVSARGDRAHVAGLVDAALGDRREASGQVRRELREAAEIDVEGAEVPAIDAREDGRRARRDVERRDSLEIVRVEAFEQREQAELARRL